MSRLGKWTPIWTGNGWHVEREDPILNDLELLADRNSRGEPLEQSEAVELAAYLNLGEQQ